MLENWKCNLLFFSRLLYSQCPQQQQAVNAVCAPWGLFRLHDIFMWDCSTGNPDHLLMTWENVSHKGFFQSLLSWRGGHEGTILWFCGQGVFALAWQHNQKPLVCNLDCWGSSHTKGDQFNCLHWACELSCSRHIWAGYSLCWLQHLWSWLSSHS